MTENWPEQLGFIAEFVQWGLSVLFLRLVGVSLVACDLPAQSVKHVIGLRKIKSEEEFYAYVVGSVVPFLEFVSQAILRKWMSLRATLWSRVLLRR